MSIPRNMLLIPVTGDEEVETFNIALDGNIYTMRFDFVQRYQSWYFTLYSSGERLFRNKICSVSFPGEYKRSVNMVPGSFFCVNSVDPNVEPGRDNFGLKKDVKLYYVSTFII